MTHLKVTGGSLKIRDSLSPDSEEKINQIRLYSGSKFEALKEAEPGMVVASPESPTRGLDRSSELPPRVLFRF